MEREGTERLLRALRAWSGRHGLSSMHADRVRDGLTFEMPDARPFDDDPGEPRDDGGRGFWERHAGRYDASVRWLGRPMSRMTGIVAASVAGADRVLEVAAGTGLVTGAIARSAREVVATDYAAAMVGQLRKRVRDEGLANVRCEQADMADLPYAEGSFDVVVAANVLHLVPDLGSALASVRRVLAPGGRLVAPTFCHDQTALSWIISRLAAFTGFPGRRRLTLKRLAEAIESAGLRVVRAELVPGPIPIGFAEAALDAPPSAAPADAAPPSQRQP